MALVARITFNGTDGVIERALGTGAAPARLKVQRGARVVIIDDVTGKQVTDVVVRESGDEIQLVARQNGEEQVLILEDGDGSGVVLTEELGSVAGSEQAMAEATATDRYFLIGDQESQGDGLLYGGLAALAVGAAALALNNSKDKESVDAAPVIDGPSGDNGAATAEATINENQTAVATMAADEDVTWSVTGGADGAKFAIDPDTGALTFVSAPDYEVPTDSDGNNTYVVEVTATDSAGNASKQTITVTVADVDDTPPAIEESSWEMMLEGGARKSVPEGSTAVLSLGSNEGVTWTLTSGLDEDLFVIDPETGVLSFRNPPSFTDPSDSDGDNAYEIEVSATDEAGNVTKQTVTIYVTDDTAPLITGPSGAAGDATSAKTVDENHTAVTTLTADEEVSWSISGGADGAKFAIDPATGALTFVSAPDYENPTDTGADNSYLVEVTATDAAGNTSTQLVTVNVANVDDTAPLITGPSGAAGDATSAKTVDENQTAVTTLTADEEVSWSISGGTDGAKFAIDPATGELTFVTPPNYENPTDDGADNTYEVEITAEDANGNTSVQTVTVTVADVADTALSIVSVVYTNDFQYFKTFDSQFAQVSAGSSQGAYWVEFSKTVSNGPSDTDTTNLGWDIGPSDNDPQPSWDYNMTGVAPGGTLDNYLLFSFARTVDQETFEATSGFAGIEQDYMDFGAGLAKEADGITDSLETNNIVSQYYWHMADGVDGTFYGGSLADMIHGGTGNDTIYGRGGADRLAGNGGTDTYVYADTTVLGNTTDSTVNDSAAAPFGYDTVTVDEGDIFDFGANVYVWGLGTTQTGTALPASGEELLNVLDFAFRSANPPLFERSATVIQFNTGEDFLVIDQNQDWVIDSTDTIIKLDGFNDAWTITTNINGDVVIGGIPT